VELRGPVSAKTSTSLTILGITVQTSASTQFSSDLGGVNSQASFFSAVTANQTVVKAEGILTSPGNISASEAEIELPD
jgi:DUF917 family protein